MRSDTATPQRRNVLSLPRVILVISVWVLLMAVLDGPVFRGRGHKAAKVQDGRIEPEGPSVQRWQWFDWEAKNEAACIRKRFQEVKSEFQDLLKELRKEREERKAGGHWSQLTASGDGRLKVSIKWPVRGEPSASIVEAPWVIAEGVYEARAQDLFDVMASKNAHWSQPLMDPFFESFTTIARYSNGVEAGRRATKRLLVYGPRDFAFGVVEERSWRQLVTGVVSLPSHPLIPEVPGYVRAYQDMIAFYTPSRNVTDVALVMRTDLRGAIPAWLFAKSCGHTGMGVMRKLGELVRKRT